MAVRNQIDRSGGGKSIPPPIGRGGATPRGGANDRSVGGSFGGTPTPPRTAGPIAPKTPAPAPPPASVGPAYPKEIAPRSVGPAYPKDTGTPYSGGGGGGITPMAAVGQEAPPPPPSLQDWLGQDAGFIAEQASLQGNRDNSLADYRSQLKNYDQDFRLALQNLGVNANNYQADDPLTQGVDETAGTYGGWDQSNRLGAYGMGLNNLQNDFSARGLRDSSFYGEGRTNFDTDMNRQLSSLEQGRGQQRGQYNQNMAAAESDYMNALNRARADSAGRGAAKYGQTLA